MLTETGVFAAVADRHRAELHGHCARLLRSRADADDAVQETFLRAWRSRHTFRGGSPRPWLYSIATNVCLNALAQRQSGPVALDDVPERQASGDEPDAVVIAKETVEIALATAARYLPPRQQACLLMRDVLRWSAHDSAAALSLSVAAANSAVQRARCGLRTQLAADRLAWGRCA